MFNKWHPIFLLLILLSSCKAFITKKYKFNQPFSFKTSDEFRDYLQNKKQFDLSHVIYPDNTSMIDFLNYISKNELVEYYGTLINDSTEIKKSANLQENVICMGRVLSDIHSNVSGTITDTSYVH